MKRKNTRKIAAGVLAAALTLQGAAVTVMPAFADETDNTSQVTPSEDTTPETTEDTSADTADTSEDTTDPTEPSDNTVQDAMALTDGTTVPSEMTQGATLIVKGTVTSASSAITSLDVGIYDASGNTVYIGTALPNSTSYDLNRMDRYITFDKLTPGTYTYKVTATNATYTSSVLTEQSFTVVSSSPSDTEDTITASNVTTIPSELKKGDSVIIKGTLTSSVSNITDVSVGIYNDSNSEIVAFNFHPNAKTFDLNSADAALTFNTLPAGTYYFRVVASNSTKTDLSIIEQTFTVMDNSAEDPNGSQQPSDAPTLTGGTEIPDSIDQGSVITVKGTVSSATTITSLTAGIYDANGTLLSGKTISPQASTYDLSGLDSIISFNTLAAGTYTFSVTASNETNTDVSLYKKTFTVNAVAAMDTLSITDASEIPESIEPGKAVNVKGVVSSASSEISSLTAGVYDESGKMMTGKTVEPKAKTYDLKALDNDVEFSKLAVGSYTFSVTATNAANKDYKLLEKSFKVANTTTVPSETDKLTITGGNDVPSSIKKGDVMTVTGTVTSASSDITSLTCGVYDSTGKFVTGKVIVPGAGTKSYNLSNLDSYIEFNKLPVGTYIFAVIASNNANKDYALVSKQFTVTDGTSTPQSEDKLSISGETKVPANLEAGKSLNVTGIVTSASSNITALTCGVYDKKNNSFVTGKTIVPNAKSYDLKNLDSYVEFNKLPAGDYIFAVIASNANNSNFALVNQSFTVGGSSSQQTPNTDDKLTITGGTNVPDTLEKGKALSITGTVTSASSNITSLTCGVYNKDTSEFVTGKTVVPNAKSYDLKNLDSYVEFNKLPDGNYTYAVIATNAANTNYALVNKEFKVGNGNSSQQTPNTDDKLTITGGTTIPDNIAQGKALSIGGTVTSASSNMTALTAGVYDANGNFVTGRTIAPNAKSYNLKNLDRYIEFNKLSAGKYRYCVIATNSANKNYALVNKEFTVGDSGQTPPASSDDKLSITGGTAIPDQIAVGKAVSIRGTVSSASSNITSLTAGVYDASGKLVTGKTVSPNAKSYNLHNLDNDIIFNKLSAGKYEYKVVATNSGNSNYTVYTKSFTVGDGGSSGGQQNTDDKLTISNGTNIPDSIAQGKALSIAGTVSSASSNITALTAGVYDANGNFVTGRTIAPNAKSYDLKNLDRYIEFNKLSAGTYSYCVIATNSGNTNYALVNKKFTVGNGGSSGGQQNTDDKLSISGGTSVPDTLAKGKALSVTGTVTSASSNITSLTVGVYDVATKKFMTGRTVVPNAKSYNLHNLDNYVEFNKLPEGTYTYAVIATNAGNTNYALVNKEFKVGNGGSSGGQQNTDDKLSISGGTNVPDNLAAGKALNVTGIVTSASSNITSLTCGVYNRDTQKFITGRTIAPNAKSYDLRKLDNYVEFNKLPAGNYTYAVIATNAGNTNYALVNKAFTVGGSSSGQSSTSDALTISGGTSVPGTVSKGKGVIVRGTVSSASSNITSLTVGVYDANGKLVTGTTVNPGAKTYDLSRADSSVRFDQLAAGSYTYKVTATNSGNSGYVLVNQSFKVQ